MRSTAAAQEPAVAPEPTTSAEPLQRLFELFNVRGLGDGDIAAGANVLAAMAATIANISAPDSGFLHQGEITPVGTSLLVSGSLTASLLVKVLASVKEAQDQLTENVNDSLRATSKDKAGQRLDDTVRFALGDPSAFGPIHRPFGHTPVRGLLGESENHKRDELLARPRIMATCTDPEQVKAYFGQAHEGRAFVHAPVASSAHAAELGLAIAGVIHGTSTSKPPRHVRGNVLATVSPNHLASCLRAGREETEWINQTLWLADIPCAPAVEVHTKPAVMLDRIESRYREAVTQAAAARLEFQQHVETNIKFDWHQAQEAFVRFLATLEPRCPGITGTARTLYVTLLFGLYKMLTAPGFNIRGQLLAGDVAAFARYLVSRMAHARQYLLESDKRERLMAMASRLAFKLEGTSGADVRTLTRKTSKLSMDTCRESLALLEASGFAVEQNEIWVLVKPASEFLKTFNQPVIDV